MRLKELLEERGLSMRKVALAVGVKPSTFHNYVYEKRQTPVNVLKALSQYFGVSIDYIIGAAPPEPKMADPGMPVMMVPVYGMIRAGAPVLMYEDIEDWYPLPKRGTPEDWLILRVDGDSMNAAGILPGSLAVFHRQPIADNGEIVAAAIDEEATIKVFYQDGAFIMLCPQSTNISYKTQRYDTRKHSVRILGVLDSVIIRYAHE